MMIQVRAWVMNLVRVIDMAVVLPFRLKISGIQSEVSPATGLLRGTRPACPGRSRDDERRTFGDSAFRRGEIVASGPDLRCCRGVKPRAARGRLDEWRRPRSGSRAGGGPDSGRARSRLPD